MTHQYTTSLEMNQDAPSEEMRAPPQESTSRTLNKSASNSSRKLFLENLSVIGQDSTNQNKGRVRIDGVSKRRGSYQHILKTLSQLSDPDDDEV